MKKPKQIIWFPCDMKKDDNSKGMWYYLPEWIVRAYGLTTMNLSGQVKITIRSDKRSMIKWRCEETNIRQYWKKNWSRKLIRERRKKELPKR